MRRALFGLLVAAVSTGAACASDPPADAPNDRPDSGEVTAPGVDAGGVDGPRFDVPECVVASGESLESATTIQDDTGTATVAVEGTGCARTFVLGSTAVRKDDLPESPRTLTEQASAPSVQTTSPMFDALYQLALEEARECSVDSIRDYAFNDGADLACAEGGCFETGRKWNYVWTRDTAYAVDLGLPWVDPVRAKNSLELKISTRRGGGDLQIVQDTGTGGSYPVSTDRTVWAIGAREVLLHLTGDARTAFRDKALEAAKNTIAHDRVIALDARDGLYRGEQSFLDWREQSYPGWASPDTVHIGMSKSLSTNVGHLSLLDLAAELATETGDSATASTMKARAAELRAAIRTRFWLAEEKQLSTFITTELDQAPVRRFDLLGTSLAVLYDVTTPAQSKDAIATYPSLPKGPPVFFPQQKDTPIYHNRAIWPFVTAYWVKAAKKVGNDAAFDAGIRSLVRGAALNLSNMENLEVVTGKPWHDDGPASGPVVNSQRQLWSVAGYIGAVNGGIFGVEAVAGGVRVAPFVPRTLRASLFGKAETIALNDLPFRGKKLSVSLRLPAGDAGAGGAYVVLSRRLNGQPLDGDVIADARLGARNLVEIELGAPTAPVAALHAIDDTSDYRTIFAPRTPSVDAVDVSGGKLRVTASFAGESSTEITWSVYRDGVRVASGLGANTTTWTDAATDGDASPSHCYTVETRWGTSGNVSQHARPFCFWGPGAARVSSVPATSFTVTGGNMTTAYGRTFPQSWGDPGDEILATFGTTRAGAHLVQAVYGNGAGPLSTGITCAVKKVTVEELPAGTVVGTGYLMMPQRADWASWGDSSFVRVNLKANTSYRVRLSHDDRSVNMSAFEHFASYTGGTGGKAGAFFRVNVAELKLLAL